MPYSGAVEVQEQVALAPYTTLGIGGPARFFIRVVSVHDLYAGIAFAREHHLPLFILGSGSNLLVADAGFAGVVLQIAFAPSIERIDIHSGVLFDVSAGTEWDALVRQTCEAGLCGMECLAGIPGSTGASPIQNIGAYGQEVADTVDQVTAIDLHALRTVELSRQACDFSYRHSIFNTTGQRRYIVTAVRFRLSPQTTPNLAYADLAPLRAACPTALDVYHFVRGIRDRKGMLIDPANRHADSHSAGSFFKNPVVAAMLLERIAETLVDATAPIPHWPAPAGSLKLPAAWLIERAGFPKGFALGPVGISTRHTLALVNRTGTATCADLLRLRDLIVLTVEDRFGITLEQEPVMLGEP